MPTPFEYRPYQPQSLAALASLVGAEQRAKAQSLREAAMIRSRELEIGGQAKANMAGTIGQTLQSLGQIPMQRQQQRAADEERALRMRGLTAQVTNDERNLEAQDAAGQQAAALQQLFGSNPNPAPEEIFAIVGPERGSEILKGQAALRIEENKLFASNTDRVNAVLSGVGALPDLLQGPEYAEARESLIASGRATPDELPEAWDPSFLQRRMRAAMTPAQQFELDNPKPVNLGRGDTLVQPNTGNVIASGVPVEPTREPNPTEASLAARAASGDAEAAKALRILREQNVSTRAPQYQWATDPKDGKVKYMSVDEIRGGGASQPQTAAERMDARKFEKSAPVLKAIGELSERINTQQGLLAKISGEAEKQKAKLNLNDDVAEYEALVSGFTPLIARSLGHTGVLTQQDVDSVKALFPRPEDSKSLRDRKVSRLMGIVQELEGADAARPQATEVPKFRYNPSTGKTEAY